MKTPKDSKNKSNQKKIKLTKIIFGSLTLLFIIVSTYYFTKHLYHININASLVSDEQLIENFIQYQSEYEQLAIMARDDRLNHVITISSASIKDNNTMEYKCEVDTINDEYIFNNCNVSEERMNKYRELQNKIHSGEIKGRIASDGNFYIKFPKDSKGVFLYHYKTKGVMYTESDFELSGTNHREPAMLKSSLQGVDCNDCLIGKQITENWYLYYEAFSE